MNVESATDFEVTSASADDAAFFIALNTFRPQLMIPLLKFFMLKIKYRPNIPRLINLAAEVCMLHMKTMK